MNTAVIDKIDKSTESFREKILRKCGESVEMKEKFFEKYADEIERAEPRNGEAIHGWEKTSHDGKRREPRRCSPFHG